MTGLRLIAGALALGLVGAGAQVEASTLNVVGAPSAPASELLQRVALQPYSLTFSVRNVQLLLNELGYNVGTPDGAAGAKTKAAIAAFQADNNLPINGTPSKVVFIQLQQAVAAAQGGSSQPQTASGGQSSGSASSSSELIMSTQAALRNLGYAVPSITGKMDEATAAAIRTYETDNDMPMTGQISEELLASLGGGGYDAGTGYEEDTAYEEDTGYPEDDTGGGSASSDEAYEIEQYLEAMGYDTGTADGVVDAKTQQAIMAFQNEMDLPVDGQPSAELLTELQTAYNEALAEQEGTGTEDTGMGTDPYGTDPYGTDPYGADPATIQAIETALKQKGYAVGQVDGVLDAKLQKAIDDFIRHNQLAMTNEPSAELLTAIEGSTITAKQGMKNDLIKTGVDALTNILTQ